ncbi:MauE/DoxX family redox-associated membrane protein [Flavivirga abyssicola]|uniref:heavy-metal-associated domain-containing protein n=1 Tax=Flavivirga abyssicola TaxID=3063533 RepID=UPI0026DFD5FF|nr:MauE/DoxX family redox-associated membrane protein [Flavivirga sp. MEBiC07777]WVK14232.1 MauE/DoxX family redox-associated membrane protein [Flavivirga sp. MEBiC07777]
MKHTYTITGMTCNGCRISVEDKLNAIDGISSAKVNLEKAEAAIEMSTHISLEVLQKALSDKYSISENSVSNISDLKEKKSEFKQLFPLFLIFGYITVASILINYSPWNGTDFMLDFMGLFYIVFSFFKLLDLKGFPESFKMYDPLAKVMPVYSWVYPFIELALGILFLMRVQIPIALIITLVILGITTIGVTKTLLKKKTIQCACLGTALKLPMTKATFIENSIMIVMAIIMLIKTYN